MRKKAREEILKKIKKMSYKLKSVKDFGVKN